MSVIWADGFKHVGAAAEFAERYTLAGGGTIQYVDFDERRAGCGGVDITNVIIARAVTLTATSVIVSFAHMMLLGTAHNLVQLKEGSTVHLTVRLDTDGTVLVYRGDHTGALLATADPGNEHPEYGTAAHIEVEATIGNGTGAGVVVRLDGVDVIDESSVDTQNGGTGAVDTVLIAGNADGARMGDLIIIDPDDGAEPVAALGPTGRVDVLLPRSTASPSQWSATSGTKPGSVAEHEQPDGDFTYVSTSTDGAIDMYGLDRLTHNPAAIHAVLLIAVAKKVSGSSTALALRASAQGLDTQISDPITLGASYAQCTAFVNVDAWTAGAEMLQDDFNAATFGFQAEV